jgi:polyhydroxyalkanoate synthesis regulator phasin
MELNMNREEARRHVDRLLTDAEYDRKRGGVDSNEDVLRTHLIEALTEPATQRQKGAA